MIGQRIGQLLQSHPDLRPVRQNMEQLASLKATLSECLPENLQVSAATLKDGELILYADNGPKAAKLKQMSLRIAAEMGKRGYEVTGIRTRVQARTGDNPLPQKQISLSDPACRAIRDLAGRLRPSTLKTALAKLGSKGRR